MNEVLIAIAIIAVLLLCVCKSKAAKGKTAEVVETKTETMAPLSQTSKPLWGYDQVTHPESFAAAPEKVALHERMKSNMVGDVWDPDSRDQIAAYYEVTPPAWSDDSLLYYGAVDAQTVQNHKAFISENWMFNQNASFADFGDNPNYPYPVTSIRLNAINNVPTDSNPHQITEDQDDGGASRNTYTDKRICYGLVQ
jgi:hypothetical protein